MSFPDNHHRLVEYAATSSSSSATPPSPPCVLPEAVHGAPGEQPQQQEQHPHQHQIIFPTVKIKIKYRGDNFANMSTSEESATTETESSPCKSSAFSPIKTAAGNMDKAAPESSQGGGVDPRSSSQNGLPGAGQQQHLQPRESSRFSDVDVNAARASHKVPDTGLLGVLDGAASNDDGPKEPTPIPENRRDKRRSGDSVTPKKVQIEEADKNSAEEEEAREATPTPPAGDGLTEEVFVVESILQHKNKGKKRLFLVRWEGYGSDEDSWEPEDNLSSAKLALEEYFKKNPSAEGGSGKKKKGRPPKALSTAVAAAAASGSKRRGRSSKEEVATPSKRSRRGEPEEEVAEEPVEEPEDQYAQEKEDEDYDGGEGGGGKGRGGAGRNKKPKTKAELKAFPKTTPTSTASKASVRRVYLETRQNWLADSSDDDDSDKEKEDGDESTPLRRRGGGLEKKTAAAAAAAANKEKERQTRASSSAGRDTTAVEKEKAVKPKRDWLHRGAVTVPEETNEEQEEDKRGSVERAGKERSSKKKDKHHQGRRGAKEDMRFSPPPPSNLAIVPSVGSSLRSATHASINGGLAVVGSGGAANNRVVVEGLFKRASSGELFTVIRDSPHSASRIITVDEARATASSALIDFLLPRMQFNEL